MKHNPHIYILYIYMQLVLPYFLYRRCIDITDVAAIYTCKKQENTMNCQICLASIHLIYMK